MLALAIPLLEAQRHWPELADALAKDAALAAGREQAEILARLGVTRLLRIKDAPGALDAFQEALAFERGARTARVTLEKLLAHGDHRLEAGAVLEPVYRREGANAALLKILDLRGSLEADVDGRLAALREAAVLARDLRTAEPGRALELLGKGLAEAVAGERALAEWLDPIDALGSAADPKRRAAILAEAIGDRGGHERRARDTGRPGGREPRGHGRRPGGDRALSPRARVRAAVRRAALPDRRPAPRSGQPARAHRAPPGGPGPREPGATA